MVKRRFINWVFFAGILAGTHLQALASEQWPELLSGQTIYAPPADVIGAFNRATQEQKNDAKKPLIAHLVIKNKLETWPTLILYGFNQDQFSPEDMAWVLSECSRPNMIEQQFANHLLKIVLDVGRGELSKDKLIKLFIDPKLRTPTYLRDETIAGTGWPIHSEYCNVLARAVDRGQLKVLETVLKKLPELTATLATKPSAERQEYRGKEPGAYFKYIYEKKSYNLMEWIMRDNSIFLSTRSVFNNYAKAGKIIVEQAIVNLSDTTPVYQLSEALVKCGHISKELHAKVAAQCNNH